LLFALVCCRPCIFPRSGHNVAAPWDLGLTHVMYTSKINEKTRWCGTRDTYHW
jgi:hypothetical protein